MSLIPKKIIGLDFHDYSAELVEIAMLKDKASLESYSRTKLAPDIIVDGEIKKPKTLKKIIKNLIQTADPNPVETRNVAMCFPSNKIITHIFTLPANLEDKEVRKAIPYEAENIIPFNMSDLYWDFATIEKEDEKQRHSSQKVLFAAIPKEIADQYSKIVQDIGLSPKLFGISAEALRYSLMPNLLTEKTAMVIDVDTLSTNYLIIKDGKIKHFFSSNNGGHKLVQELANSLGLTEEEIINKKEEDKLGKIPKLDKINEFIEENYKRAQKIINEQIQTQRISTVDTIYLTGKFLDMPHLIDLAKTYFPNQTVAIGDPKLKLLVETERFSNIKSTNEEKTPFSIYFTNAIGIALRTLYAEASNGINLLPDKLKESLSNKKTSTLIGIASITMAVISLITATFLTFKFQEMKYLRADKEIKKASIQKIIYGTRYQEIRDQINSFNNEVDALTRIDQGLFSLPLTIQKVYSLVPKDITISALNFIDEDISFEMTGVAKSREDILEMTRNLEEAEWISEVIAPISNYDEKSQISFIIEIKLDFPKLDRYGSS